MPATPTQAVGRRMDGGRPSAMRGDSGGEASSFRQLAGEGTQQDVGQAQEAAEMQPQAGGQDQPALDEQVSTPAKLRDLLKKLRDDEIPVEVTWTAAANPVAPQQDAQASDAVARQLGFADADALAAAIRAARQTHTATSQEATTNSEAKAALTGQPFPSQAAQVTATPPDADPTQTAQTQQTNTAPKIAVDAIVAGGNAQAATGAEVVGMQAARESADAVAAVAAATTQTATHGTQTETVVAKPTAGNVAKPTPQAVAVTSPVVDAGPVNASATQSDSTARSDVPTPTTPTQPQTPVITHAAPQATEQATNDAAAATQQTSAQPHAGTQQAAVAVAAEAASPRKTTESAVAVTTQTQPVAESMETPVAPPRNRLAETLAARFQQMSNETNQPAATPQQNNDAARAEQGLAPQAATMAKSNQSPTDAANGADAQPARVETNAPRPIQPTQIQAQQNPQSSMADGLVRAAVDAKSERPTDSVAPTTDVFASPEAGEARSVAPGIATTSTQAAEKSAAVDQVTTAIRYEATANTRELTVQMDPPELGKVHIQIRSEGGELRGVVQVENARTFDDLQREAPQLLERLQEAGIRVKDLEFQMNDSGRGDHGQPNGQQAQNAYAQFSQGDGHRGQAWAADGEDSGRAGTVFDGEDAGEDPRGDGQYVGSGTLNVMI